MRLRNNVSQFSLRLNNVTRGWMCREGAWSGARRAHCVESSDLNGVIRWTLRHIEKSALCSACERRQHKDAPERTRSSCCV